MSRSKKKNPFNGIAGGSEKYDKRKANRIFRRKTKRENRLIDPFAGERDHKYPKMREVSNKWLMNKDGKFYFKEDQYPKLMRK